MKDIKYATINIINIFYLKIMCNIFLRHYVFSFIGLTFFVALFLGNLEMVYMNNTILTDFWIPNYVGWLYPLAYIVLFLLFIVFQTRCILNIKHSKRNLKNMHKFLSIWYGFFALILLFLILFGHNILFVCFAILVALWLRNFYIFYRLKTKTYIWNIDIKDFYKKFWIWIAIFWLILAIFYRPILPDFEKHVNISELEFEYIQREIRENIAIPESQEYLLNIALKKDTKADYEVLIYNLSDENIAILDTIYTSTQELWELNKNIEYDLSNLMLAQRFNLIKFQYEVLHGDNQTAKNTIKHILELNNQILEYGNNYIDSKVFVKIQTYSLLLYKQYFPLFTNEQNTEILSSVKDVNPQVLWENVLEKELLFRMKQYGYIYNIPLVLNKKEAKNIEYYYFVQKITQPLKDINSINPHWSRSNFLWITLTNINTDYPIRHYEILEELAQIIQELKNSLY